MVWNSVCFWNDVSLPAKDLPVVAFIAGAAKVDWLASRQGGASIRRSLSFAFSILKPKLLILA